jgi:hypothetical protein
MSLKSCFSHANDNIVARHMRPEQGGGEANVPHMITTKTISALNPQRLYQQKEAFQITP